jgi:hypothetical protein
MIFWWAIGTPILILIGIAVPLFLLLPIRPGLACFQCSLRSRMLPWLVRPPSTIPTILYRRTYPLFTHGSIMFS